MTDSPLDAFVAAVAETGRLIERLNDLVGNHFHCHPDLVNWGDVGSVRYLNCYLRQGLCHFDPPEAGHV